MVVIETKGGVALGTLLLSSLIARANAVAAEDMEALCQHSVLLSHYMQAVKRAHCYRTTDTIFLLSPVHEAKNACNYHNDGYGPTMVWVRGV